MKKLVLATAIAALSVTAAQAAPTVYGKAFLSLDTATVRAEVGGVSSGWNETRTQLNSNDSRIGLKGSEALTANTDVVYKLEYRVQLDNDGIGGNSSDNKRNFESRDTYLGLSNKQYGTLLAGRLTAIDGRVDYANVTAGKVLGGDNVLASIDAKRANNAFAYVSPTYNGLTASAMYVMDENSGDTVVETPVYGKPGTPDADKVIGHTKTTVKGTDTFNHDGFGVAVQYEPANQPFRAGASYLQVDELKAVRVSGAFDVTPAATVGALYQNTKFVKGGEAENAFTVSGTYKTQTPWTAYGQIDVVNQVAGVKDSDKQRYVVGGKYAFNKAATGHIYGAVQNAEVSNVETRSAGIGAGLEYNF